MVVAESINTTMHFPRILNAISLPFALVLHLVFHAIDFLHLPVNWFYFFINAPRARRQSVDAASTKSIAAASAIVGNACDVMVYGSLQHHHLHGL
jgi:hypothetical protein